MKICINVECPIDPKFQKFGKQSRAKDGLQTVCKYCSNLKSKLYKQKMRATSQKFRDKDKSYRDANKEHRKQLAIDYKNNDPIGYKTMYKSYRDKHKDQRNASAKIYREKNKVIIAEKKKLKSASDISRKAYKRYQEIRNLYITSTKDGSINPTSIKKLREQQNNLCKYCYTFLDMLPSRKIQLDHVIPLSKNGKHIISNVVWSCQRCNLQKFDSII